jgi:AcrR family transcriptional regulator
LEERPAHEVTVIAIMARTTLSRKSFYVYFRDRADLLASLVAPLRVEADAALQRWREATDSVPAGRAALRSAALLYLRHGVILRALAEASQRDADATRVWRQVIEPVVAVAAQTIADATAAGESYGLDPEPTARALVSMNVHYFFEQLVGNPSADIDATTATITAIWERTIYLRQPVPSEGPATARLARS